MRFVLGAEAARAGYRLLALDAVDSTNAEALRRAAGGEAGPLWVVSDSQNAGRGRRGRSWETPPGNLAASLLLSLPTEPRRAATLGFVAGLALVAALQRLAPDLRDAEDPRVRLKWPNDVLLGGRKLAGILLETGSRQNGLLPVVIGIGVNVRHSPEALGQSATALAAAGLPFTAADVFAALSDGWLEPYGAWAQAAGFGPLRDRWLASAAGVGRPVAVRTGERLIEGVLETLDDEGRLVIRAAGGRTEHVAAGEVHFGTAASAGAA